MSKAMKHLIFPSKVCKNALISEELFLHSYLNGSKEVTHSQCAYTG